MRIAFYCDGTYNDPGTNNNVYRMAMATLQVPGQQQRFYDPGVGTDGCAIDRLFGGAFGKGLVDKVKDAYTQIAHAYTQGDEIFLFGFSRGAYTARCVAGMIAICGLPCNPVDQFCVDTAFTAYRNTDAVQRSAELAKLTAYKMQDAEIKMVGVWDTVGSLGIPATFGGIDQHLYGFLSVSLHPDVKNAFHAMALDEQRQQFPATLWQGPYAADQHVEQVWFAGVHCDVGGGYSPAPTDNGTRLADISLGWMMGKAIGLGLQLDPAITAKYLDASGPVPVTTLGGLYAMDHINNSKTGLYSLEQPVHRPVAAGSTVSNSVAVRIMHDTSYSPIKLTLSGRNLDPSYPTVPTVLTAQPLAWS